MPLPQEKYYTVEDFYNMPDDIRAELIEGQIVYMASPSRLHQDISHELDFAITSYIKSKGGKCRVYTAPFGVQLNDKKDIEIASPSNPSHDYITKLNLYHEAHVREYWIVDDQSSQVLVYNMESGQFVIKAYSFTDTIKAGIFDDLYINFSSLDLGI